MERVTKDAPPNGVQTMERITKNAPPNGVQTKALDEKATRDAKADFDQISTIQLGK